VRNMAEERRGLLYSSIRAFLLAFFGLLGASIALIIAIAMLSRAVGPEPISHESLVADAQGKREMQASSAPILLQVAIQGVIGATTLTGSTVEDQLLKTQEGALKDRVKGIMLLINSPGGSATDSYQIYQLVRTYKERHKVPVIAYCEGPALSGGYMIACAADQILASPLSVVGSIGVVSMPFFNVSETMEKLGIREKTFTAGKGKDVLNPFRPWTPDEGAELQPLMDDTYRIFREMVAKARPKISAEALAADYGAAIFTIPDGLKIGLVDAIASTREEALKTLLQEAGLSETAPYQVVDLHKRSWIQELLNNQSPLLTGRWTHELTLPQTNSLR
jgi:protease IV